MVKGEPVYAKISVEREAVRLLFVRVTKKCLHLVVKAQVKRLLVRHAII